MADRDLARRTPVARRVRLAAGGFVAGALGIGLIGGPLGGFVSPGAARPLVQATTAAGSSRANPVPVGQEAVAGPLRITITDVAAGQTAVDQVLATSPNNLPPATGATFVLTNVTVTNAGEQPIFVSNDDFGLTGSSGVIHRFLIAEPPAPALFGTIAPGESASGWLVFEAPPDETDLLLVFDSLSLDGNWADVTMMVQAGATIADAATPGPGPNNAGLDPASPAGLNQPVIIDNWQVEIVDVAFGAEVFDLVDYRTGALGAEDANNDTPWLALRVRVTNTAAGGTAAHFPANAFGLATEDGAFLPNTMTLTPPVPDAAGDYYPGASREGWVAFELPSYDPYLIIFNPYGATVPSPSPRYLSYE